MGACALKKSKVNPNAIAPIQRLDTEEDRQSKMNEQPKDSARDKPASDQATIEATIVIKEDVKQH